MARKMVDMFHGDFADTYREIDYFIQSDYNPKDTYEQFMEKYNVAERKYNAELEKGAKSEKIKKYSAYMGRMKKQMQYLTESYHDFDKLEDNVAWEGHEANMTNPVFYVKCVGEFFK
ncbi:MAG: hypothetical protein PHE02_07025 [Lachnospiraceae bacterium]|nr:hypothetical protein [Lachnospiraceae bacterium]